MRPKLLRGGLQAKTRQGAARPTCLALNVDAIAVEGGSLCATNPVVFYTISFTTSITELYIGVSPRQSHASDPKAPNPITEMLTPPPPSTLHLTHVAR